MFYNANIMIYCGIALLILHIIEYLTKYNINYFNLKNSINIEPRKEVQQQNKRRLIGKTLENDVLPLSICLKE
jgi:hypothetical protein